MNRLFAGLLIVPLLLSVQAAAQDIAKLDTLDQRYSYMIGLQIARSLKQQGLSERLDVDAVAQAFRDGFAGVEPRLTPEQMQQVITEIRAERTQAENAKAATSQAAGAEFLAENRKKSDVQTTASGLQYKIVKAGSGPVPQASNTVKVHYEGRLLNGTVFDSSYARGSPTTFGVGQVIPGWQEALQLMPVGSTWEIWVPSDLAYGPSGAGGDIGPNETLNFTVELLEIVSR